MFDRIALTLSRGEFRQLLQGQIGQLRAPQPSGTTCSASSQLEPGTVSAQGFRPKLRREEMDNPPLSLRQSKDTKDVNFSLFVVDRAFSMLNVCLTRNSGLPKKPFKNSQLLLQALQILQARKSSVLGGHSEGAVRRSQIKLHFSPS